MEIPGAEAEGDKRLGTLITPCKCYSAGLFWQRLMYVLMCVSCDKCAPMQVNGVLKGSLSLFKSGISAVSSARCPVCGLVVCQ